MKRQSGYTLIEILIAMVIFAVITAATSFAVSAALKSQQAIRIRTDELQEARTVLNVIARDLRGAYASAGNPATLFLAGGNYSGTLLTFSTQAHKVVDPNGSASADTNQNNQVAAQPQSDVSIVQYSFTPETGQLSRTETAVPNPDALGEPGKPETTLSRHVHSISFQFLVDPTTGFRQEWNYVTQQQQQQQTQTGTSPSTQTDAQASGDTTLPQSVQVQIEFINSEGIPRQYTTVVMLTTAAVQPIGQKPEAAIQPLQPAGTGGQGGGGQGGGGQGGGQGGGTPGGPRPGGSLPGLGAGSGMLGRP